MKKNIIEKHLKNNRKVDRAKLCDVIKVVEELRAKGIKSSGYNISPPFAKRLRVSSDIEDNSSVYFK